MCEFTDWPKTKKTMTRQTRAPTFPSSPEATPYVASGRFDSHYSKPLLAGRHINGETT